MLAFIQARGSTRPRVFSNHIVLRFGLLSARTPLPPPAMQTEHMNASHWRKSTQWIGLTRPHAEVVLRDEEVYRS